ncbi:MAG: hypothetical protein ABIG39_02375 [Candidatus Micrarchaeota archaeon]
MVFSFTGAALVAVLASFIPGFLLAYPLLKRSGLRIFEIAVFSFVIGLFLPPAMLFFESLIGMQFSYGLVLGNLALLSIIGGVFTLREWKPAQRKFNISMNLDDISGGIGLFGEGKKNWVWIALLVILLFAYWVRITGYEGNPYSHSPDPYSYLVSTRFILTQGSIPLNDDLAWGGELASHREKPLMQYMLASWYSLYTFGGDEFDRLVLLKLADLYLAIFGALGCLLLFVLLSQYVGDEFGVLGALQGTLIPVTVIYVAWGPEQVPWALFAMLAFFASYMLLAKDNKWEYALLASVAMLGVSLGSKGDLFVYSVLMVYILIQGALLFFNRGLDRKFVLQNGLIIGVGILSLLAFYSYKGTGLSSIALLGFSLAYLIVLYGAKGILPKEMKRGDMLNIATLMLIVGAVAYVSPLGSVVDGYMTAAFSEGPSLFSTIAEQQSMSPEEYVQALGPIGAGVGGIKILDLMMILFLLIIAFDFMYLDSKNAVFMGIALIPLYILFSYKLKFVSYLGIMTAIAVTVCLGRLYGLTRDLEKMGEADKERKKMLGHAGVAVIFLGVALIAIQSTLFGIDIFPFVTVHASGGDLESMCVEYQSAYNPISQKIFCNKIPAHWVDTLNWMRENTDEDGAVLAWWDYGHWINYLGERKVVLRNDLARPDRVQEVAHLLTQNSSAFMAGQMEGYDAKYLLLDNELFLKWDSITYLACLSKNKTGEEFYLTGGERSQCEEELDFEFFLNPQAVSLSGYCSVDPEPYLKVSTNRGNTYCIPREVTTVTEILDEDMANPMNVSFHSMGIVRGNIQTVALFMLYLEEDNVGKGRAYDSIFYKGWQEIGLDGFEQVYATNETSRSIRVYEVG